MEEICTGGNSGGRWKASGGRVVEKWTGEEQVTEQARQAGLKQSGITNTKGERDKYNEVKIGERVPAAWSGDSKARGKRKAKRRHKRYDAMGPGRKVIGQRARGKGQAKRRR